jgi:hypothetical protein
VHGFAVFEEDYAENSVFKFGYSSPSAYTPIGLDFLGFWVLNGIQNPLVLDASPVGSTPRVEEILGMLHVEDGSQAAGLRLASRWGSRRCGSWLGRTSLAV